MRSLVVVLFILGSALSSSVSYEGYKVISVIPQKDQLDILHFLEESGKYDFWSPVRKDLTPVDIMVSPKDQQPFYEWLNNYHFKWTIKIENVQKTIDQENAAKQKAAPVFKNERISFDRYYSYEQMEEYLDSLVERFPNKVTIDTYGKSYEGRPLKGLRISTGGDNTRPLIFIDSGIHAREWITHSMALYIIDQLLDNPKNSYMIENMDWIVIPNVNPDGYEFSSSDDRFWRKTRSETSVSGCPGTDANRNFNHHWASGGSSDYPCSDTYHGPTAFSEPETKHFSEYATKFADRTEFYLGFHSYGQYIVYPWDYTEVLPEDDALLRKVGEIGHAAIRAVNGTRYLVGNTVEILYIASGGCHDFFKGELGVELSFTLELPGGGWSGFDLPPEEIYGVVVETFEGVRAWYQYVADNL